MAQKRKRAENRKCQGWEIGRINLPETECMSMNERILLIDDELIPLSVLTEMLEMAGYQVEARQSGREALIAFEQDPYAYGVIISDQFLDGVLGLTLSKEFLKLRFDIPIIICTGDVEEVGAKAHDMGIRWCLQKPVTFEKLSQTVAAALTSR